MKGGTPQRTVSSLRRDESHRLAPSVKNSSWRDDPPVWKFVGTNLNLTCSFEDVGFFLISLDGGRVVEEVLPDDPILPYFLQHFDGKPIELVYSRLGKFRTGWWLEFGDGQTFGTTRPGRLHWFLKSLPGYNETRYVLTNGVELPPLV